MIQKNFHISLLLKVFQSMDQANSFTIECVESQLNQTECHFWNQNDLQDKPMMVINSSWG